MSVALVTGGSSGIGRAIAVELSKAGYRVVLVGRTVKRLHEVELALRQITGDSGAQIALMADVRDERQVAGAVATALSQYGQIDLLIASAGIGRAPGARVLPHSSAALSLKEWQQVIDINLTGIFLINRAVLPSMIRRRKGHIINISSSTTRYGLRGQPYAPAYCASKFAMVGLTESLAEEVAPYGIRVQVLFPGAVNSAMLADTDLMQRFGQVMSVSDVAQSVRYLATSKEDTVVVHPHLIPFGSQV